MTGKREKHNECIHLTFFRAVPLRSTPLQKAGDAGRYTRKLGA